MCCAVCCRIPVSLYAGMALAFGIAQLGLGVFKVRPYRLSQGSHLHISPVEHRMNAASDVFRRGVVTVGPPGLRRCNLEVLKTEGLLRGSLEDLQEADVGALFMPHGLGHLLGIDTHDVGGYGADLPPRSTRPGLKSLRLGR